MRPAAILLTAILLCGGGCGEPDPPTVVLYVSADSHLARAVIDRFEEQSGLQVQMVTDTEATKTTGLAERLRSEKGNPQADVFWSSESFMTIQLAQEDVLAAHTSAATAEWPGPHDGDGRWYGFASRARVIVYAPDRVPIEHVPEMWMDLTQSRWKGRIVMADPRFGTTRGHMGAMLAVWSRSFSREFYTAFLEGLAANDVQLLTSGNAGVVRAVAGGEADIGMTDTDDVWAAQKNDLNVEFVYPYHGFPGERGRGTLLIPNTVARVKGGPNPAEAARLIDFLLSAEVERMIAESDSHNMPVRPELASEFPDYAVPDPLLIDLSAVASVMDEAVRLAMDKLDRKDD